MKLWVDDVRPKPEGYDLRARSVNQAKTFILTFYDIRAKKSGIDLISLDHDAGMYVEGGGDYINILNWMEELQYQGYDFSGVKFRIHSMNVVGRQNMEAIIKKNGWELIK